MDEQNRQNYPGEEYHYSQPPYSQTGKIRVPNSQVQSQRLIRILVGSTTVLLVVVIVFGFLIVHLLTAQSSPQPLSVAKSTTVATSSQTGTIPTPTETPAQTPMPLPAGTVLCESGGTNGWGNWQLSGPWKLLPSDSSILLNDGSESSYLTAPQNCQPQTADYAVEVTAKGLRNQCTIAISVRRVANKGYIGSVNDYGRLQNVKDVIISDASDNSTFGGLIDVNISLDTSNVHRYQMEVKSNSLSFLIDGRVVSSTLDNKYFSPGQVSFLVGGQAEVTGFKVQII